MSYYHISYEIISYQIEYYHKVTERVKEINKKRIKVWEKMKTLEKRKKKNNNLLEEIQK